MTKYMIVFVALGVAGVSISAVSSFWALYAMLRVAVSYGGLPWQALAVIPIGYVVTAISLVALKELGDK